MRDGDHANGKLADRDESPGGNRTTIRAILETDVQKWQSRNRGFGLVFEAPSAPLLAGRIWRAATRAEGCVLGDIAGAFAAGFRGTPPIDGTP